jgi:predicted secreted Zn-dependent protease
MGSLWAANAIVQQAGAVAKPATKATSVQPLAAAAADTAAAQQTSAKPATGAVVAKPSPVPICTIGAVTQPQPVSLSSSQPGLIKALQTTGTYTIYGNDVSQINNQMFSCSPVAIGNSHFAASTDYVISWNFGIRSDGTDSCTLTDVRVGLSIGQTFPAWQATARNPAVTAQWQRFISNLTTHENGHAQLDSQYAQTLLATLQAFPAAHCGDISALANARAQSIVADLNRANDAYDAVTNHGSTQGAVLR